MHRNAPLTPEGRFRLCQMIEEGWPVATAAESMRISRQTAHKWWRRYQEAGVAGLTDRSSRPKHCPTKTPERLERRLVELRRRHQLGPAPARPKSGRCRLDPPPSAPAPRGLPPFGPGTARVVGSSAASRPHGSASLPIST